MTEKNTNYDKHVSNDNYDGNFDDNDDKNDQINIKKGQQFRAGARKKHYFRKEKWGSNCSGEKTIPGEEGTLCSLVTSLSPNLSPNLVIMKKVFFWCVISLNSGSPQLGAATANNCIVWFSPFGAHQFSFWCKPIAGQVHIVQCFCVRV